KTDKEKCGYRQYQNDGEHYGRSRGQSTCFAARDCRTSAWRAFHRRCCKPSGPFVTLEEYQRPERDDCEYHRLSHRNHVLTSLTCPEDLERQHAHVATEVEWCTERRHRRHKRQQRSSDKRGSELWQEHAPEYVELRRSQAARGFGETCVNPAQARTRQHVEKRIHRVRVKEQQGRPASQTPRWIREREK